MIGLPVTAGPMHAGLSISLHPPRSPTENENIEQLDLFHPAVRSTPLQLPDSTLASFAKARASVQSFAEGYDPEAIPGKDVSVCTLGTGSAIPSKFRNGELFTVHFTLARYLYGDSLWNTYPHSKPWLHPS